MDGCWRQERRSYTSEEQKGGVADPWRAEVGGVGSQTPGGQKISWFQ
jgi:hypothetical protein